jgi:hypothetical protein
LADLYYWGRLGCFWHRSADSASIPSTSSVGGDLAGTAQNVGASVGSHGADRLGRVTSAADAILHEALELSPEDRADVAAELLASLEPADDPDMVRTLWAQELEERARSVLSGKSPGEDWAIVRQRLADELAR